MGMGGDGAASHAGAGRQSPPLPSAPPHAEKRKRGEGGPGNKHDVLEMERITQKVQRLHGPSFEEDGRDRSQYSKVSARAKRKRGGAAGKTPARAHGAAFSLEQSPAIFLTLLRLLPPVRAPPARR